jgi:hypothetical protein
MTFFIQFTIGIALVGAFMAGVLLLGNLLPVSLMAAAITSANTYISILYHVMPSTTIAMFVAIGSIASIEGMIGTYKAVKWVYTKIPGIS